MRCMPTVHCDKYGSFDSRSIGNEALLVFKIWMDE